jgi:hypothetical protein
VQQQLPGLVFRLRDGVDAHHNVASSASWTRHRPPDERPVRLRDVAEPTREDVDALVGPATPHFAYQLRARVEELVSDLPEDHPVRQYGEERMELLDRLGHASSKADDGPREPASRLGWDQVPSSAPAYDPLLPEG